MLARARKVQHAIAGRMPYSRARGCKALAQGRGEEWLVRAEEQAARLDASVALFLLFSAAFGLAGVALMSRWLGAGFGLSLALCFFCMAGTMWIDKQVSAVKEQAYLFKP